MGRFFQSRKSAFAHSRARTHTFARYAGGDGCRARRHLLIRSNSPHTDWRATRTNFRPSVDPPIDGRQFVGQLCCISVFQSGLFNSLMLTPNDWGGGVTKTEGTQETCGPSCLSTDLQQKKGRKRKEQWLPSLLHDSSTPLAHVQPPGLSLTRPETQLA